MFNPQELTLSDPYVKKKLEYLLRVPGTDLGCLEEDLSLEQLLVKCQKAHFLQIHQRIGKVVHLYETEDLGLGLTNVFSMKSLKRMVDCQKLSPLIPVHVRYLYGNLFFLIDQDDIDRHLLRTKTVTLGYHEGLRQVYDIYVGGYVAPNRLYHLRKYHGITTTLEKALKNDLVSSFHVHSFSSDLSDMPQ